MNVNDEKNDVQTPEFGDEEMKMPENNDVTPDIKGSSNKVVNGPLLIILTVLLIAILGGLYYWFSNLTAEVPAPPAPVIERPTPAENNEPESTTAEVQTEVLETTSTSDELGAIEADLEATDLDSLDAELEAIDVELEASTE